MSPPVDIPKPYKLMMFDPILPEASLLTNVNIRYHGVGEKGTVLHQHPEVHIYEEYTDPQFNLTMIRYTFTDTVPVYYVTINTPRDLENILKIQEQLIVCYNPQVEGMVLIQPRGL